MSASAASLTLPSLTLKTLSSSNPKFKLFSLNPSSSIRLLSNPISISSFLLPSHRVSPPFSSRFVRNVAVSSDYGQEEGTLEVDGDDSSYAPDLKLFVGNLPFTVDSAQLAGLFESAGQVERVEVIYDKTTGRSRGFGFVTMSTVGEVEAAAQQFNGYELDGRLLRVNYGPPPPKRDDSSFRGSRNASRFDNRNRVHVSNLAWGVDDLTLENLFREKGNVLEASFRSGTATATATNHKPQPSFASSPPKLNAFTFYYSSNNLNYPPKPLSFLPLNFQFFKFPSSPFSFSSPTTSFSSSGSSPMEETALVDVQPALPTSDKRPIEIHDDNQLAEPQSRKKPRNACDLGPNLRRVAEIVLVMSTMTALRGGKKPSDAEVGLMAEARAKLVRICEGLPPKDIVGREGISALIEDLGLHARDQKLGFRGPRLTIAEKLAQSKKKMEDSKKYGPPPGYGSHTTQKGSSSSVESRGPLPTVRMFPSEKPGPVPASVGGTAGTLPSGHGSVAGPTSIQVQAQTPSNEVRSHIISSGYSIGRQGMDSSSLLHGTERPLNGAYGSQMQVNSLANHPLASAPTWSAQTQSALTTKGGPEHKFPNHSAVNAQGTTDSRALRSSSQAARDQSFRPPISQTGTGNLTGLQPPLQNMNFVQGPSLSNNHNEIVKIIQKLLQPQLPDHPTWNPPSRDYMNKAVTCQTCQVTINEIDTVLICDACEKGYHLKCVQSPNQRAIPRGEWHCPRCLTISNGKPLPPKYGRVMRSNPPPKLSVNTSGTQLLEKRSGAIEQKASAGQLKLVSNGGSDLPTPQPADYGSNANESSGIKISNVEEIHGNNFLPIRKDIDEKPIPTSPTSLNTPAKSLGLVCEPSSGELSSETSAQPIKSSQASIGDDKSSTKEEPPEESQTTADSSSLPKPPDIPRIVDQKMVSAGPEIPSSTASAHDTSIVKKDDHEVLQENNVENFEASIINREQPGASSNDLHNVEWIGEQYQILDMRAYYKSCRVDGVTYKVEEFALFQSSNGKLMPYRLHSFSHEYESGLKWAILKKCYFYEDLPKEVAHLHPCSPEEHEVYTSDGYICLDLGLIRGPCEVLSVAKYKEELERRKQLSPGEDNGIKPIFLCKWFYTEASKEFVPFTGAICENFSVTQSQPLQEEIQSQPSQEQIQSQPSQEQIQSQPLQEQIQSQPLQEQIQSQPLQEQVDG